MKSQMQKLERVLFGGDPKILFDGKTPPMVEMTNNDFEQAKKLVYKMGRNSLKRELEDWLNNGFEYENSTLTVHNVREVLQRYTQND